MELLTSIDQIKGVGPKTAEHFRAAGISTVEDLLYFLPRNYSDFSVITSIKNIAPGEVSLKVFADSVTGRYVRRGLHITEAILKDDSGKVRAVWFNQPYRAAQLKPGQEFFIAGTYGFERNRYLVLNPSVEQVSDLPVQAGRIVPIYRQTKNLKAHVIRKVLRNLQPLITVLPETMPPKIIQQNKLISLNQALTGLHFPTSMSQVESGRERLAFEELLILQLAALLNKRDNSNLKAWPIKFDQDLAKKFVAKLPFKLTDAQRLAAWEIVKNLDTVQPMNRLLQGDVGAGKTVVAAFAAFLAARAGYQTAVLAPTEILASQHAETLHNLLKNWQIETALLTSSVKGAARQELLKNLKAGSIAVAIGTHALLQATVEFKKLGLVIIDEQHRFGVKQRQMLLTKAAKMPHVLSMTATPIPRSLMLTVYGELDVSIINQLPKGRQKIITKIILPTNRAELNQTVLEQLKTGRQVYVICPKITEAGELNEVKSAEAEFKRLKNSALKNYQIGLLHGQLKADQKAKVMQAFAAGKINILVATTVVEVGVDVPNASVMIIEAADRFGLAQLHQLRGRVGRGKNQSYCFLVPSSVQAGLNRLRELEKSADGFYLAERDLELRGPGEIYGRAQHGQLDLRVASLGDSRLVAKSRQAAEKLLKDTNLLQYKHLMAKVNYFRRLTTLN